MLRTFYNVAFFYIEKFTNELRRQKWHYMLRSKMSSFISELVLIVFRV
jgi:hypothetical protein